MIKNDQEIGAQCSLWILHTPAAFTPITIRSNLWILILNSCYARISCNNDLPWYGNKCNAVSAINSHPEATISLQCYIKTFPPTPTLWGSCGKNGHISWKSKFQCNQYLNSRFSYITAFQQQLDYNPHADIWQTCPKFLSYNFTNIWSARVSLFCHLSSTAIRMKNPLLHENS